MKHPEEGQVKESLTDVETFEIEGIEDWYHER